MNREDIPQEAIDRARDDAEEWLAGNGEGWPRSWGQELAYAAQSPDWTRSWGWEAPPIVGYEALEREGLAVRAGRVLRGGGEERIHFRAVSA